MDQGRIEHNELSDGKFAVVGTNCPVRLYPQGWVDTTVSRQGSGEAGTIRDTDKGIMFLCLRLRSLILLYGTS